MAGGILGTIVNAALPGLLPSVAETAKILVDRLVPDPARRDEAQRELEAVITARETAIQTTIQQQNEAQNAINLAEAQGNDRFSSRWRPAAAWVCVAALVYQYLFAPIVTWMGALVGVALGFAFPAPPTLVMTDLWPVLIGLLGLGGMRTYERTTGVPGALPPQPARR